MNTTTSEQLILGIVAEEPRHGYDIEKLIVQRGMRKWADIGFSSIYYVLDKLGGKGLVQSTPARGKEKKQYSITEQGLRELKEAAAHLIAQRKPANTHFMTGVAVSNFLTDAVFSEALVQRRAELTRDLMALKAQQSTAMHVPLAAQRLFSLSEALIVAELGWIAEQLKGDTHESTR